MNTIKYIGSNPIVVNHKMVLPGETIEVESAIFEQLNAEHPTQFIVVKGDLAKSDPTQIETAEVLPHDAPSEVDSTAGTRRANSKRRAVSTPA